VAEGALAMERALLGRREKSVDDAWPPS